MEPKLKPATQEKSLAGGMGKRRRGRKGRKEKQNRKSELSKKNKKSVSAPRRLN
jgi:hypothetical protein